MVKKLCILAAVASFAFAQSAAVADGGNLWKLADKSGSIRVFIYEPVNESGQGAIIPDTFKKSLESILINRKATKFEIAKDPKSCDVRVSSLIKKFQYMEKGPMKPTPSIGTTLLDVAATMTENYVEITVAFVVTNPGTGGILWKETVNPYIKKRIEPEASIALICDKAAKHFVWKCFGKPS